MHLRSTIAKAEDITEEMIVNEDGLQKEDLTGKCFASMLWVD